MTTTTRLRVGLTLTILLGLMWAAVGLFDSLTQVAVGLILAGVSGVGIGLVDYLDNRRDAHLAQGRAEVWERRRGL